jgi:hypothetical protein
MRFGGLGIRRIAPHAPIANAVAIMRAKAYLRANAVGLMPDRSHLVSIDGVGDRLAAMATDRFGLVPEVATLPPLADWFGATLRLLDGPEPGCVPEDVQKQRSSSLEHARQIALLDDLRRNASAASIRHAACIEAASAKYASLWLYSSTFVVGPKLWLTNLEFVAAAMMRLGIPLSAAPKPCQRCGVAGVSDVLGDHAATCLNGGWRTRLHTALLDEFVSIATLAGAGPRREVHAFADEPSLRLDACVTLPGDRDTERLCDVAATHAAAPYHVGSGHVGPSAAATAYEDVKRAKYGAALQRNRPRDVLVPVVVDSFGGLGASAVEMLRSLAAAWSRRVDAPLSSCTRQVMHRVVFTAVRGFARLAAADAVAPMATA